MSVFTKNYLDNSYQLFVKGSPEKLLELCVKESIPDNFNAVLDDYTQRGYRVIALAYKNQISDYSQMMVAKRDEVENNL